MNIFGFLPTVKKKYIYIYIFLKKLKYYQREPEQARRTTRKENSKANPGTQKQKRAHPKTKQPAKTQHTKTKQYIYYKKSIFKKKKRYMKT